MELHLRSAWVDKVALGVAPGAATPEFPIKSGLDNLCGSAGWDKIALELTKHDLSKETTE